MQQVGQGSWSRISDEDDGSPESGALDKIGKELSRYPYWKSDEQKEQYQNVPQFSGMNLHS